MYSVAAQSKLNPTFPLSNTAAHFSVIALGSHQALQGLNCPYLPDQTITWSIICAILQNMVVFTQSRYCPSTFLSSCCWYSLVNVPFFDRLPS